MTWQPIETAPKDDTLVDLWIPYKKDKANRGSRATDMILVPDGRKGAFYTARYQGPVCVRCASHWMPVPSAPEA